MSGVEIRVTADQFKVISKTKDGKRVSFLCDIVKNGSGKIEMSESGDMAVRAMIPIYAWGKTQEEAGAKLMEYYLSLLDKTEAL